MYILIYYRAIVQKIVKLMLSLNCTMKLLNSMRRKMYAFSYTPLLTRATVRFDQSTEYCSIVRLLRVGCCMFYLSKIHNIGYILLKQTSVKTPETLKKNFSGKSPQTKQPAIVIKVVRNQDKLEDVLQFWENYTPEHSVLKKSTKRASTTIK